MVDTQWWGAPATDPGPQLGRAGWASVDGLPRWASVRKMNSWPVPALKEVVCVSEGSSGFLC